jgi:hypothetical protein
MPYVEIVAPLAVADPFGRQPRLALCFIRRAEPLHRLAELFERPVTLDQTQPRCTSNCFSAASDVELHKQMLRVRFDCLRSDVQTARDLFV